MFLFFQCGVDLRFTRPTHVVDGDVKMVLGAVWAIIQHHQIRSIHVGSSHGREGLLVCPIPFFLIYENLQTDTIQLF